MPYWKYCVVIMVTFCLGHKIECNKYHRHDSYSNMRKTVMDRKTWLKRWGIVCTELKNSDILALLRMSSSIAMDLLPKSLLTTVVKICRIEHIPNLVLVIFLWYIFISPWPFRQPVVFYFSEYGIQLLKNSFLSIIVPKYLNLYTFYHGSFQSILWIVHHYWLPVSLYFWKLEWLFTFYFCLRFL